MLRFAPDKEIWSALNLADRGCVAIYRRGSVLQRIRLQEGRLSDTWRTRLATGFAWYIPAATPQDIDCKLFECLDRMPVPQ